MQEKVCIWKSINTSYHINRLKVTNHMIISTDVEGWILTKVHVKFLKKLGIEGINYNIIKTIYDKPIATLYLTEKNSKHFHKYEEQYYFSILMQYTT